MAQWLAARYAVGMKQLEGQHGDPAAAWNWLRECCHDVVALRRGEYRAQRLELVRAGLALRCQRLGLEEATGGVSTGQDGRRTGANPNDE